MSRAIEARDTAAQEQYSAANIFVMRYLPWLPGAARMMLRLLLWAILLLYLQCAAAALKHVHCVSVDLKGFGSTESVTAYDRNVLCYEGPHKSVLAAAWLCVIVFVIAVPLWMSAWFYRVALRSFNRFPGMDDVAPGSEGTSQAVVQPMYSSDGRVIGGVQALVREPQSVSLFRTGRGYLVGWEPIVHAEYAGRYSFLKIGFIATFGLFAVFAEFLGGRASITGQAFRLVLSTIVICVLAALHFKLQPLAVKQTRHFHRAKLIYGVLFVAELGVVANFVTCLYALYYVNSPGMRSASIAIQWVLIAAMFPLALEALRLLIVDGIICCKLIADLVQRSSLSRPKPDIVVPLQPEAVRARPGASVSMSPSALRYAIHQPRVRRASNSAAVQPDNPSFQRVGAKPATVRPDVRSPTAAFTAPVIDVRSPTPRSMGGEAKPSSGSHVQPVSPQRYHGDMDNGPASAPPSSLGMFGWNPSKPRRKIEGLVPASAAFTVSRTAGLAGSPLPALPPSSPHTPGPGRTFGAFSVPALNTSRLGSPRRERTSPGTARSRASATFASPVIPNAPPVAVDEEVSPVHSTGSQHRRNLRVYGSPPNATRSQGQSPAHYDAKGTPELEGSPHVRSSTRPGSRSRSRRRESRRHSARAPHGTPTMQLQGRVGGGPGDDGAGSDGLPLYAHPSQQRRFMTGQEGDIRRALNEPAGVDRGRPEEPAADAPPPRTQSSQPRRHRTQQEGDVLRALNEPAGGSGARPDEPEGLGRM